MNRHSREAGQDIESDLFGSPEDQMDEQEYLRLQRISSLQQAAMRQNDPNVIPQIAIIIAVLALLLEPMGWFMAGGACIPFIYSMFRKLSNNGAQDKWIEQTGNFAHALNKIQLIQLARYTSKDTVIAQLTEALYSDMPVTPAGMQILEKAGVSKDSVDVDCIFDNQFQGRLDSAFTNSDAYAMRPDTPVGGFTKLNAVPVQSAPIKPSEEAPSTQGKSQWSDGPNEDLSTAIRPDTALAELVDSALISTAFFGSQRTGKSMLVAILGKILADQGIKIFHVNLLSYSDVSTDEDKLYTGHVFKSVRGDISCASEQEKASLIAKAMRLVQEWWDCSEKAIIVVDEWAYLSSEHAGRANEIVNVISGKLAAAASSGIKRGKAVYPILPLMVAGDMVKAGKSIKGIRPCYVTIAPGRWVDWAGQKITFDDQLFTQVKRNFDGVQDRPDLYRLPDADRIACINGKWLELGTHPDMLPIIKKERVFNPVTSYQLNGEDEDDLIVDESECNDIKDAALKVVGVLTKKGSLPAYEIRSRIRAVKGASNKRLWDDTICFLLSLKCIERTDRNGKLIYALSARPDIVEQTVRSCSNG